MKQLAWGKSVSPEFRERVLGMAMRDGYDPSHAMAVMHFESRLNPVAVNSLSGASGLIQFMPNTALDLNTTIEKIRGMTAMEQLDYVDRYFHRYAGKMKTLSDTYMAVLWPVAVGQPEDYVLFQQGSKAYEQNKALDLNRDGKITKAEATSFVQKSLDLGMQNASPLGESQPISKEPHMGASLIAAFLPAIFEMFAGRAAAAVQKISGAPADTSAKFVTDMANKVIDLAGGGAITDNASALKAVATVVDDQAKMQELQQHAVDYLEKVAPFIDKIASYEQANWKANDDSADRASARWANVKNDIALPLVHQANYLFIATLAGVALLVGLQVWLNKGVVDSGTYALLSVLVYGVVRMADRPSAHRFGGAYDSAAVNSGSTVINQTIEERRKV